MLERIIPSSGEKVPITGMGTWQSFNVISQTDKQQAADALAALGAQGGRFIDSSPMYGRAEEVIGDITAVSPLKDAFFYATKVWTTGLQQGIQQMEQSFEKMKRQTIDLMQIHNLVDWKTHLPQLRKMKEAGRIRYIGITHYTNNSHQDLARIIRSEPVDFLQCNYSLFNRQAEDFLLKTAADHGVAVLANRPFGEGGFLQHLQGVQLPAWAAELGVHSWAGFILKYIIAHPAITVVIPATRSSIHAADNAAAGNGLIPDETFRKKMIDYIKSL